jgi:O-antigen/teichoic acid export membrane protein
MSLEGNWVTTYERRVEELGNITGTETWVIPAINVGRDGKKTGKQSGTVDTTAAGQSPVLLKLAKSSGIYALASAAAPLVSLVLAPFLTHHLSASDYGALAITNTAIGLGVGITQLGLFSAFFRAYSYDYTSRHDRCDVVATVTALLLLASVSMASVVVMTAPWLASLLYGQPSLSNYVALAGGVILLQNLTVPGLAWLRAEGRPLLFTLLWISNLLVTLLANIYLVGVLRWGGAGSIIANGSGFACIVICTLPVIVVRAGVKIRIDMAKSLLAFGLPLVLNFVAYWVLQLSDRYLLSLFVSLAETARYAVVYALGSAMSVVVMGAFTLAWPTAMFAIAKREDAAQVFRLVFRWFSLFLLFAAFGFSVVGRFILYWLFPVTYHLAAPVIPLVTESIVFYGVYYVFMVGANVRRKTWLAAVFTTLAAVVNVAVNLVLIPLFGAMGAAASTLIAYMVLALAAYIVNQRLYPIPFEIGRFTLAFVIGIALYLGSSYLVQSEGTYVTYGTYLAFLALYGSCLLLIGAVGKAGLESELKGKPLIGRQSYERKN